MRLAWNTSHVPPREAWSYWRDCVSRAYLPLEPEAASPAAFSGSIDLGAGDAFSLSHVRSLASVVRRTRQGIAARQDGRFFANLILNGKVLVHQGNACRTVHAGEIMLVDTDEPFSLDFSEGVDLFCVAFGDDRLRRALTGCPMEHRLAVTHPALGRVLVGYIGALGCDLDAVAEHAEFAGEQIAALVTRAASLSAGLGAPEPIGLADRAVRLIEDDLANPTLGAKSIARALGIGRTTLYEALAARHLTLSALIDDRRLAMCRADLRHPSSRDNSIGEIARRWGFRDVATFSRLFKRRTGTTPSAYRRGA